MRRLTLPLALAAALCVASCTDESSQPLDPSGEIPVDLLTPSLTILDGNNGEGGNEHFFWLRPIGSAKRFDGIADPSIFPTVVICERVDIDGCDDLQAPLATYQRNVGEDKDRIRLDGKDEYFVHWRMKDYTPQRNGQYRIRVLIQGHELGHADVIVLRNREIRAYVGDENDELIPVSDRGNFKVSFRIEEGALASQFCDFDGDDDVADCAADQEIAGDGIDTQIQVTSTEGGTEVVAIITAPDAVFIDVNGNTIPEVVISAEVEILPPSFDVFTDDNQELPVFVEVNTFPSDVYIDPNGPGVDVVICQDETVLANRGITPGLHSQLILYKVGDNGITRRLVSTPVACAAPIPAPPAQGFAALLRRGMDKVRSIVGPQPVVARRRLHGGLNTVITRDVSLDEAFSTFGAALGPLADSTEAILPANGDVGITVPITIQVRNALGENFAMGGDTLDVTIIGGPNAGATVTVVDNANGIHSASYTPTAVGLDSISIILIRADGVGLGPIGGSPYTLPILGPMQVINTADSGLGSLRDAMNNANAAPGEDTVTFAIPGPGPHVIALATELPEILDAVVIDGTSQPGYAGVPVVEVNGASVSSGPLTGHGFAIKASNTEVSGLAVTQHPRSGIFVLNGLSNVRVVDNYIGTDAAGSAAKGNTKAGVLMRSAGSLISGNLISGNAQYGVRVDFPTASGNTIQNNTIGLDPAGTAALPNTWSGIALWNGSPNTVIQNNTISGNDQHGIDIRQSASQAFVTGTQILGNTIGLDINGDVLSRGATDIIDNASFNWGPYDRGNLGSGIRMKNAPNTTIGAAGQANVISGNTLNGIDVQESATNVTIRANRIGTDASGTANRGNGSYGADGIAVSSSGTSGLVIGGTGAGDGNVISGNFSEGIGILGTTDNVRIEGNLIGTDASGTAALGNGLVHTTPDVQGCCHSGVFVGDGTNIVIGGSAPGAGNVVSGNNTGLWIGLAPGIQIEGNKIGTNQAGTSFLPNVADGGIALYGTQNAVVKDNVISGNTALAGIFMAFGPANNLIQGNTFTGNTNAAIVGHPSGGSANTFRSNSMSGNGFGIDLHWDNHTANDLLDADAGFNGLQNHPVLTLAEDNGVGGANLSVSINSYASTAFTLEVFASATCHGSGYGEGAASLLVTTTPATDGSGNASFVVAVPGAAVGQVLTATLTHPDGSTSEFSACETVAVAPVPPPVITSVVPTLNGGVNQGLTFFGSAMNNTLWTFTDTTTAATYSGFTFLSPSTSTAQYVATFGIPAGSYWVTVTDQTTTGVSAPVLMNLSSQFGTPTLVGVFTAGGSPVTSTSSGSTIYIQGYGIYTTGNSACFTQGSAPTPGPSCSGTLVGSTSTSSGATIGLRARFTVPVLSSGPAWIQLRSGNSDFTAPVMVNIP